MKYSIFWLFVFLVFDWNLSAQQGPKLIQASVALHEACRHALSRSGADRSFAHLVIHAGNQGQGGTNGFNRGNSQRHFFGTTDALDSARWGNTAQSRAGLLIVHDVKYEALAPLLDHLGKYLRFYPSGDLAIHTIVGPLETILMHPEDWPNVGSTTIDHPVEELVNSPWFPVILMELAKKSKNGVVLSTNFYSAGETIGQIVNRAGFRWEKLGAGRSYVYPNGVVDADIPIRYRISSPLSVDTSGGR